MHLAGCPEDQEQIKAKLDTEQEPLKENHSAILLGRWEMKKDIMVVRLRQNQSWEMNSDSLRLLP